MSVSPTVSNRTYWESAIKAKYPHCVLSNNGTFIYAMIDNVDVGLYSIIGNYGKIFDLVGDSEKLKPNWSK